MKSKKRHFFGKEKTLISRCGYVKINPKTKKSRCKMKKAKWIRSPENLESAVITFAKKIKLGTAFSKAIIRECCSRRMTLRICSVLRAAWKFPWEADGQSVTLDLES